jgi:hypothetical protein
MPKLTPGFQTITKRKKSSITRTVPPSLTM